MKCYHCNGDTLRDKLINKGWVTPFNADTLVRLIEEHYAELAKPVPVSERLPGPEDCDAEGRCWWGRNESDDWSADWTLATHEAVAEFCEFCPRTVWLPAHALPLPSGEVEE